MVYIPNPTDATQPTDAVIAETAAPEFRALKAYLITQFGTTTGYQAISVAQLPVPYHALPDNNITDFGGFPPDLVNEAATYEISYPGVTVDYGGIP